MDDTPVWQINDRARCNRTGGVAACMCVIAHMKRGQAEISRCFAGEPGFPYGLLPAREGSRSLSFSAAGQDYGVMKRQTRFRRVLCVPPDIHCSAVLSNLPVDRIVV